MPQFHLVPIVTMCIVMMVVMIRSLGMFLALGDITGKRVDQDALTRGLRADGVGTLLGGIFNTFPTPRSRRMSGWSASPASGRAGSRWRAASSCWRWA